MGELKIFKNSSFGEVRVAGTSEEPLFCLADVCRILELGNPSQVKSRLSDGVISNEGIIDSLGRTQNAVFVNEDGLYDVILDSRKPEAKQFRKWVTSEVLPSIRSHGGYLTPDKIEEALTDPDTLIRLATTLKDERQKRLEAESIVKENASRVLFSQAVETSKRSCLIAELAKILSQNGVKIGQNRLFEWMRNNGYLGSKGEYYNQPSQRSMELGLFEVKKTSVNRPDGTVIVSNTTKVTGKGQIYFVDKFLARGN